MYRKYLPLLQAALRSGELDIDLVHMQNRTKKSTETTPDSASPEPPRPESESPAPDGAPREWKVGDTCRALFMMTEYDAVIKEITPDADGNKYAIVRFTGSGNEELLRLDELKEAEKRADTGSLSSSPKRLSRSGSTPATPKARARYGFLWDKKAMEGAAASKCECDSFVTKKMFDEFDRCLLCNYR